MTIIAPEGVVRVGQPQVDPHLLAATIAKLELIPAVTGRGRNKHEKSASFLTCLSLYRSAPWLNAELLTSRASRWRQSHAPVRTECRIAEPTFAAMMLCAYGQNGGCGSVEPKLTLRHTGQRRTKGGRLLRRPKRRDARVLPRFHLKELIDEIDGSGSRSCRHPGVRWL